MGTPIADILDDYSVNRCEDTMNRYEEGHLFVAAVRVLRHQLGAPPSLEELCSMLGISVEAGGATCRSLAQQNILEMIEDPFSVKVIIQDHLLLEELPDFRRRKRAKSVI